ncbi:SURF1 family protein [Cellulomonas carbonis]|uniref:SURF1 family protein n=1 Tax=Cellulomonas carbonis TaxID=1386092 RepID=UPI001E651565|nr:SURF1 family protein [Cellulomonas carbonis]
MDARETRHAVGSDGRPRLGFWRVALTPRMVGLLLLFLGVAAVCGRLGVWQLDRAVERSEQNAAVRAAELESSPGDPLDEVLAPQQTFAGELVGRKVEVSGRFEGRTLLVPGRARGDDVGFLVLDAFRVDEGGVLAVVRGWVADPVAPPAPEGPVTMTGFLQAGEASEPGPQPEGRIGAISPGELVNRWGGPIYSGYLVAADPGPGVGKLPPPSVPGAGLNLQNLAYAVQWWIFGGFAVLLWSRLVRDEVRALAEEAAEAEDDRDGARVAEAPGGGGRRPHDGGEDHTPGGPDVHASPTGADDGSPSAPDRSPAV